MTSPRYKGIVFDMDGTLTMPTLDFAAIRTELDMPSGDLAHHIYALPEKPQRQAWAVIERHEEEALQRMTLQTGATELLTDCREAGLRLGVVTRNTERSVDNLCRNFGLCFDCTLTRTFKHMKPHPGPVLHMIEAWRLSPEGILMVGDYVHDIECGRAAGVDTCFFQNPSYPDHGEQADYTVHSMVELHRLIFDDVK